MLSRRDALRGGAAVAVASSVPSVAWAHEPIIALVDEIKRVRNAWHTADEAFEDACDKAGYRLSDQLELDGGLVLIQDGDFERVWGRCEIEEAAEHGQITPKARDRYLAQCDAQAEKAAQIRREIGVDELAHEKNALRERYWELRAEICDTPAHSVRGILAKMRGYYDEDEYPRMLANDREYVDNLEGQFAASIYRDLVSLAGEA